MKIQNPLSGEKNEKKIFQCRRLKILSKMLVLNEWNER